MTGLETAGGLRISEGTLSRNIILRRGERELWSCLEENRKNRKKKTCFQKAGRATAKPFYIRASIGCWGMIKSCMRLTGREVKKEKKRQERRSVESGRASEVVGKNHRVFPSQRSCCSVTNSCPTLCDPMDCITPGCPIFHYLPEFAQTYVYWFVIQPSHCLLPPSPPELKPSQH